MRAFPKGVRSMRRLLRGLVGSALIAATVITAVGAHSGRKPTAGASKAFTNDQVLTYGYGATTYPSWVYTVGNGVLTSLWVDPAKNNSHMPTLSQVAPNTGRIYFSPSSTSPCSGSLEWLQCARNTRMTNWEIYIRNFALAPHPVNNWHWYDTTNSCQATGLCFYARRTMLHETLHAVLVGGSHDERGEDDTIMGSTSPWASNTGWNKTYIEHCDHAAAQLKYGVKNSAGVYADCFLNITNHGPAGLKSRATVGSSSYSACIGATATATGRLAIATDSTNYQALSNTPLSNRTLWFERKRDHVQLPGALRRRDGCRRLAVHQLAGDDDYRDDVLDHLVVGVLSLLRPSGERALGRRLTRAPVIMGVRRS